MNYQHLVIIPNLSNQYVLASPALIAIGFSLIGQWFARWFVNVAI